MATPIPQNQARFTVDEIVAATNGSIVAPGASAEVVGVTTDSRSVPRGGLFVALRGERHDGHAFAPSVARKVAGAVLLERHRAVEVVACGPCAAALVEVEDTLVGWGDLARAHLLRWRSRAVAPAVVAVT